MPSRVILLWSMPFEVMLLIEYASGVLYQNQVGGVNCLQRRLEGVLASFDMSPSSFEGIMNCAYIPGMGISTEIADAVDAILASEAEGTYVRVDRSRLGESCEAWIHVTVEGPRSMDPDAALGFPGSWYGFGATRGVLTWPNSD